MKNIKIQNFGPIKDDTVLLSDLTYFVGRNNVGKSHYLKAVELLLSTGTRKEQISKWQNDKSKPIKLVGEFEGIAEYTDLVKASNHKSVIEKTIKDGVLSVVATLDPDNGETVGILDGNGGIYNPTGFSGNLLKVLPEPIYIPATADTVQELADKSTTALGKIKKEVMSVFFEELASKTKSALTGLEEFLNSKDPAVRSEEIYQFERDLRSEFMGEFSNIIPSIEFRLPDERDIASNMKIFLDDGDKTEVDQKGNGLQRAVLLALLKLLARKGQRYMQRPAPIFLIGEVESFLHPYAQREMANSLALMKDMYQIITTTHSPFIITPDTIGGYRRIRKEREIGTKNVAIDQSNIDINSIKRHLERRGNLEGLFADRIILIEGRLDENFYQRIMNLFRLSFPPGKFTLFVKGDGAKQLRLTMEFYQMMKFDDIAAICDLDYLFCHDIAHLLEKVGLDKNIPEKLRAHIQWNERGDPSLKFILNGLKEHGRPAILDETIDSLTKNRIFVLKEGSPEMYFKNDRGNKGGWANLESEEDLLEKEYLKELMTSILS